jgi:translin
VDLDPLAESFQRTFDEKMAAREIGLATARRAIRSSAEAIRAIHRGDRAVAETRMQEARGALDECEKALADEPDVYHAGFLHDAMKEYAEARLTEALVDGREFPSPEELRVGAAAYLNGMAECIGEGRRAILDLLRKGDLERGQRILQAMDHMYAVLVSMDYPDAITGNLRRSTDVARSIMEKTRGDLTLSLMQQRLSEALDRHAAEMEKRD